MNDLQSSRLASITDEVKDFHPLLKKLLPKLPNVAHVDYTHGTAELGADFVVTLQNTTFATEFFAAVIAKVGNIEQASVDSIERQIKECQIARLAGDGRRTVQITEIWIATNGTISTNARTKIHSFFPNRNLYFIYRERLTELIDKYMSSYWTDIDLDIAEYLNAIREKNEKLDKNLSLLQIGDKSFYIEQDIIEAEAERYDATGHKRPAIVRKISLSNNLFDKRVTLVEGSAGMGKSKLLRNLVAHYAEPARYVTDKVVPIYVSYASFHANHAGSVDKAIASAMGDPALRAIGEDVKILLLIDGMDERNQSPEEQTATLQKIVEETKSNPACTVMLTTRYVAVSQEEHFAKMDVRLLEIQDLSLTRILEFVRNLCAYSNLPNRIIEDLKRSPLFKELPKSPIAAILLARLLRDNQKDIPSNMTELYAQYLEIILGRWDIEKGLQTQREYEALDTILTDIAVYFIENELGYLSIDEALGYFDKYLTPRHLNIESKVLFQKMIARCEIIFVDYERNRLAFKHRTFAEFLYARRLVKTGAAKMSRKALQTYWANSFFFMAGLLKDCPELIDDYVALEPKNEYEHWIKMANAGSLMLAGFTTEYCHIEAGIKKMYEEMAMLYKAAIDGTVELEIAKQMRMSAVELLGFCQYWMKENYSYDFFLKAVESAAYALEADSNAKEFRPYALFFLYTTSLELGKPEVADLVIRTLGIDMPLAVRLGLHIEALSLKAKTKLLKKVDHHTMDILRENRRSNFQARVLLATPMTKSKAQGSGKEKGGC